MERIIPITSRPSLNRKFYFISLCLILLLPSCRNSDEAYFEFREIENGNWSKNNTLVFDVDSSLIDVGVPYRITLELIHTANYPYQNLWFYMQNNLENQSVPKHESLEYMVCDEFGKWHGSGFGSLFQLSLTYRDNFVFKEKRNYQFKIQQGMRDEPLAGIDKVGFKIERLK
ncbi:MAG: gliding motility lipoprotein GldH [Dysgonomonas sp.]